MVIDQLNSNGGAVVNCCFVQVGVFKDLESKDCEDFLSVVDVLRSKYNFTQTWIAHVCPIQVLILWSLECIFTRILVRASMMPL
jgi:hypothetical protein